MTHQTQARQCRMQRRWGRIFVLQSTVRCSGRNHQVAELFTGATWLDALKFIHARKYAFNAL